VPLLNNALAFALQLRKITEKHSQGSRIVLDTNCCADLAALILLYSHPWLRPCLTSDPLVGTTEGKYSNVGNQLKVSE
jgi:hypothetical protein